MSKFVTYAKAISDIVAKPLFIAIGVAGLIVGLGNISVTVESLKTFATGLGALCLVLGLAEPMIAYGKAVFSAAKGKK